MDIVSDGKELTGLNGIFEHILRGVIEDPRWIIRWVGWDDNTRTLNVAFSVNGKFVKQLDIAITESSMLRPV